MNRVPSSFADIFFGGEVPTTNSNGGLPKGADPRDWFIFNQLLTSRAEFLNRFFDPRRSIKDECGYPASVSNITKENLQDLHDNEALASRVNWCLAEESWQVTPSIYEIEDPERWTPFEESWRNLGRQLRGESSWFKDEPGSVVWEFLHRADALSGIGHFGIILLGLDGDEDLSEPAELKKPKPPKKPKKEPPPGELDLENLPGEEETPPLPPMPPKASVGVTRKSPFNNRSLISNIPPNFAPKRRRPASPPDAEEQDIEAYMSRDDGEDSTDDGEDGGLGGDGLDYLPEEDLPTDEEGNPIPLDELPPEEKMALEDQQGLLPGEEPKPEGPIIGPSPPPKRKLLYLRVFPESLVDITEYEADPTNERFGQPVYYNVTFNDPRDQKGGIGLTTATKRVHWTRVIHLADNKESSEVFGIPRQRPVIRNLLNLEKLYGASPEGFWKSCFMGLSLETNPTLGGDVKVDQQGLKDMMENYGNGLQKWIALQGMVAKTLAPSVVDPTPHINAQIEAICIRLGIPKRVFMGSERGELASSQDDAAWNDRLKRRQDEYVTPRVIVPFVDRLIALDVLSEPSAYDPGSAVEDFPGYSVWWPDLTSNTATERAGILAQKTTAYAAYVQGQLNSLIPEMDYMTKFDDLTEEEAAAILDNAEALSADRELEQMKEQEKQMSLEEEKIARGIVPDPNDPDLIPDMAPGGGFPPNGLPPKPNPFGGGGKGFPPKPGSRISAKPKPPPFAR